MSEKTFLCLNTISPSLSGLKFESLSEIFKTPTIKRLLIAPARTQLSNVFITTKNLINTHYSHLNAT